MSRTAPSRGRKLQETSIRESGSNDGSGSDWIDWITTIELAALLKCHVCSIPRFVKYKPAFPQPTLVLGRNLFRKSDVQTYFADATAASNRKRAAAATRDPDHAA